MALPTYATGEAARTTGLTERQVRYLAVQGILGPSIRAAQGPGTRARYDFADLVALRCIALLRRLGDPSLEQVRELVDELVRRRGQPLDELRLYTENGRRFFVQHGAAGLEAALQRGQALFAIDLGTVQRELGRNLAAEGLPFPIEHVVPYAA